MEDSGRGIAPEDKGKIFDRLYKGYQSFEGLGVGISICKGIVDLYKGKIDIDSEGLGKGTKVVVTLPVVK